MILSPTPQEVFAVFKKNYRLIPLEQFSDNPYKTLISTLLSSRTKDEVTFEASNRLFSQAPNFEKLLTLDRKNIEKIIYPVGFYKTKAKQIKNLSSIVIERFDGKVPKKLDNLLTLPGVGRKTANLVLNRAYKIPAIAVDTHVHRISNILGWVNTKTPQQTEIVLTTILPKKYWSDINRLFVSIGRQYTTKKKLVEFLQNEKLLN